MRVIDLVLGTEMFLPDIGQHVSVAMLIVLAEYYRKFDIVENLTCLDPPDTKFSSGGCLMWSDHFMGEKDIFAACFWHDVRYWIGRGGDEFARLYADLELAKDVAAIAGPELARTMFIGVSLGGSDKLKTPFRWGYGRLQNG